ncbi:hypothetical protein J1614_000327 [Plenodomus biglobosus]|nr:hypothetical protein J1614_000327 [Plenodomus biglobosus]
MNGAYSCADLKADHGPPWKPMANEAVSQHPRTGQALGKHWPNAEGSSWLVEPCCPAAGCTMRHGLPVVPTLSICSLTRRKHAASP